MKKLKDYLKKNKVTVLELSSKMIVPTITIYMWLNGTSRPSIKNAIKLEKATNGEITVYDWA